MDREFAEWLRTVWISGIRAEDRITVGFKISRIPTRDDGRQIRVVSLLYSLFACVGSALAIRI
jgi:hypothetical protein